MENMVTVFLFGKKYEVPESLTIMEAMEYSGYQLVRGCGCRNGFCGACATIYRIAGDREQLYPEIYSCVGCNACTKACTQGLNVMQYIAYAQRGEYEKCAEESFDCVMCGVCSSRCPAGISHPQVAMLARRLNGKYLAPHCEHLDVRVEEIREGKFEALIENLMEKPLSEIKELYNHREIEA